MPRRVICDLVKECSYCGCDHFEIHDEDRICKQFIRGFRCPRETVCSEVRDGFDATGEAVLDGLFPVVKS